MHCVEEPSRRRRDVALFLALFLIFGGKLENRAAAMSVRPMHVHRQHTTSTALALAILAIATVLQ